MVEVSAGQVLHLKQPPGPAPCPVGPVELQGATHPVVRARAGCDGLVLGVAGLAQLLPELQHPAHVAGQLSGQRVGHILFCQPRQLYAPVVEPAEELGTAAGVGQPGQCLALGGLLLRDQRRAGEGALYQGHIHSHAPAFISTSSRHCCMMLSGTGQGASFRSLARSAITSIPLYLQNSRHLSGSC